MVRAIFLHDLAGKRKGSGRGQYHAAAAKTEPGGGGDVVEAPRLSRQIVGAVAGFDVIIVRAAVEREMSRGRCLTAVLVVGDLVGPQNVVAVVNLGISVQLVDVPVFFLVHRADRCHVLVLRGRLTRTGSVGRCGFRFLLTFFLTLRSRR